VTDSNTDQLLEITRYVDYMAHKISDLPDIRKIVETRAQSFDNFRETIEGCKF
jgi:hypothetical protein